MHPVRCVSLNIYTIYAVEHIEVIHIYGSRECLHRREYIAYRDAKHLCPVTVHIKVKLRDVSLHGCRQTRDHRQTRRIRAQGVNGILQISICRVRLCLKHHLETAGCAETWNDSRREDISLALGIFRQAVEYTVPHLFDIVRLTLVPGFENHGKLGMSLICAHTWRRPRHVQHIFHILVCHQHFHRPFRHLPRTLNRRALGKFKFYGEIPLVFL